MLEPLILPFDIEPVVSLEVPVVSQPESASESKAAAAAVKMRRMFLDHSDSAMPERSSMRTGHTLGALLFSPEP
jgi:hypothetical protein